MKHVWSVLCSKSITDREENLISLINCIEHIKIEVDEKNKEEIKQKIKGIPVNLELVNLWFDNDIKKIRKFEVMVKIFDNKNQEIEKFSGAFVLVENMKRMRTRMKIGVLPIIKSGLYFLKISFKEEKAKDYREVAEIPLEIETNLN